MIPIVLKKGGLPPEAGFVDVLGVDELPPDGQRTVQLGFVPVLLCRNGERIHAVAGLCPHALQPLEGGGVVNGAIRCPKHGALFDLGTGRPLNGVTNKPLRIHEFRIQSGRIEVARD